MVFSLAGDLFIAGGSVVLVPNGTRALIVSQPLNRVGPLLQLESLALNSQQGPKVDLLVEIRHNGDSVHVETFNKVGFGTDCNALPFYRINPFGVLEVWVTNVIGSPSTLTAMVLGHYVSGD